MYVCRYGQLGLLEKCGQAALSERLRHEGGQLRLFFFLSEVFYTAEMLTERQRDIQVVRG